MKKCVLSVLFLIVAPIACFGASEGGLGAPATPQSYHVAGSPTATTSSKPGLTNQATANTKTAVKKTSVAATKIAPKQSEAAAMAQVKKIMAAAKQFQEQKTKTADKQQPNQQAVTADTASKEAQTSNAQVMPGNERPMVMPANSQIAPRPQTNNSNPYTINQIAKAGSTYQQQTAERIQQLSMQNAQLQGNLQRLRKALVMMNQEVSGLNQQLQQLHTKTNQTAPSTQTWLGDVTSHVSLWLSYLMLAVIIFLLLLLIFMMSRRRQAAVNAVMLSEQATVEADPDTETEYDFMGSDEAIPAKLDLAQAYITMEDFAAATKVLEEVVQRGNEEQQQQAKELLSSIDAS